MDQVCRRDDEAEEILTILADKDHLIGTYNLGVFYQNRNDEANARKYFEKAEKLAGKSVISYSVHLPEIFDRNGELLVKNSFYRKRHNPGRVYTRGGKFAASLIGHVSTWEYNFNGPQPAGREIFSERDGVEYMIIKKNICHPVYLTIDATLQSRLEKLITDIDAKSTPMYAYGVIVSSKGELIAAAQNIVFDLEKRDFRNIDEWNFNFMPSGYVFPVADPTHGGRVYHEQRVFRAVAVGQLHSGCVDEKASGGRTDQCACGRGRVSGGRGVAVFAEMVGGGRDAVSGNVRVFV